MEIILSLGAKCALNAGAADIRMLAEACESLPYTTYRERAERATCVRFLKYAKNVAICLACLSEIRGDVSLLLPAVKIEIMRALTTQGYLPDGGTASRLRSRLLCAQEQIEAIDRGER